MRRRLRATAGAAAALALALAVACSREPVDAGPVLTIGVGSTTEQSVLAALTVVALDAEGIVWDRAEGLSGTNGLRRLARTGEVDLFWDYTGAAWARGLYQQAPPADADDSYERVKFADERDNNFVWLDRAEANATLALFIRRGAEATSELVTLSALSAELTDGAPLCADADFLQREGGLAALAAEYPINLDQLQVLAMPEAQAIEGVAAGECFAGLGTATSGAAYNAGLIPVSDDRQLFPAFVVAPVVREEALEAEPRLPEVLRRITGWLTTERLRELNARVEGGAPPLQVAEEALAEAAPPD